MFFLLGQLTNRSALQVGRDALLLQPSQLASDLAQMANEGDDLAISWLSRLLKSGVTKQLLIDVGAKIRGVRLAASPRANTEGGLFWVQNLLAGEDSFPDRESAYALTVLRVIDGDQVRRLKRCSDEECSRFYFRDPRAEWCSDACRMRNYMRAKRKEAKVRQIL